MRERFFPRSSAEWPMSGYGIFGADRQISVFNRALYSIPFSHLLRLNAVAATI